MDATGRLSVTVKVAGVGLCSALDIFRPIKMHNRQLVTKARTNTKLCNKQALVTETVILEEL